MTNFQNLKDHIVNLSVSNNFMAAKNEWVLDHIIFNDDWDYCPCGKEIKEICYIRNELNGNITYVGNVCVNQFLNINTGTLFDGLKRIYRDKSNAKPNQALINYSYSKGFIFDSEIDFLMSIKRKRNLSVKQQAWLEKINRRILNQTVVK